MKNIEKFSIYNSAQCRRSFSFKGISLPCAKADKTVENNDFSPHLNNSTTALLKRK